MKAHSQIPPLFWKSPIGQNILDSGPEYLAVAFHLMVSLRETISGLSHLPLGLIAGDCEVSLDQTEEIMADFSKWDFAHYDEQNEIVWVVAVAKQHIREPLHWGDERRHLLLQELDCCLDSLLVRKFWQRFGKRALPAH